MNELQLFVERSAYELRLDDRPAARLDGGAASLLGGAADQLREVDIEAAIDRAEEWLMPLVGTARARPLRVHDGAGRIRAGLAGPGPYSAADVESAFTRAFDAVAFGRPVEREQVADIVLLRELVHHADVRGIVFA